MSWAQMRLGPRRQLGQAVPHPRTDAARFAVGLCCSGSVPPWPSGSLPLHAVSETCISRRKQPIPPLIDFILLWPPSCCGVCATGMIRTCGKDKGRECNARGRDKHGGVASRTRPLAGFKPTKTRVPAQHIAVCMQAAARSRPGRCDLG
ncbi:hypothetical protein BT67DRAFT_439035 [Trichocladium antarcticum]|uniref:Uncharacterized protein n=1 Tax=Trichocladium antarcticum TaxID=1450529 RepID=A0AAN6ZH89_9PEZI|nr:hypothetical protein BT67DRAFT_439035 [Trichocladium antarcticum]